MIAKYNKCYSPSYRDDFFNDVVSKRYYGSNYASSPAVNIVEDKEAYRIDLAAAGLSKKDFEIKIENNILTISSVDKEEAQADNSGYTRREFNYTSFSRSFKLDERIDQDSVKAKHENGVLSVTLPLKEQEIEKGPKSIQIS